MPIVAAQKEMLPFSEVSVELVSDALGELRCHVTRFVERAAKEVRSERAGLEAAIAAKNSLDVLRQSAQRALSVRIYLSAGENCLRMIDRISEVAVDVPKLTAHREIGADLRISEALLLLYRLARHFRIEKLQSVARLVNHLKSQKTLVSLTTGSFSPEHSMLPKPTQEEIDQYLREITLEVSPRPDQSGEEKPLMRLFFFESSSDPLASARSQEMEKFIRAAEELRNHGV